MKAKHEITSGKMWRKAPTKLEDCSKIYQMVKCLETCEETKLQSNELPLVSVKVFEQFRYSEAQTYFAAFIESINKEMKDKVKILEEAKK